MKLSFDHPKSLLLDLDSKFTSNHLLNEFTSNHLLNVLQTKSQYLAEVCSQHSLRHTVANDYLAITYTWSEPLLPLLRIIQKEYHEERLPLPYLWIDIVNINQNAKNIVEELHVLPYIYKGCTKHVISISECFTRGWCLFEIAVHNQDEDVSLDIMRYSYFDSSQYVATYQEVVRKLFCEGKPSRVLDYDGKLESQVRKFLDSPEAATMEDAKKGLEIVAPYSFEVSKFTVERDREFVQMSIDKWYKNTERFNTVCKMVLIKLLSIYFNQPNK